ncbi:hypothetical protein D7X12_38875, partial [Corallococcus sicarius]
EGFHTETGPGVFEAAIRYDTLELAADRGALFKTVVKEICARHVRVRVPAEDVVPSCRRLFALRPPMESPV